VDQVAIAEVGTSAYQQNVGLGGKKKLEKEATRAKGPRKF